MSVLLWKCEVFNLKLTQTFAETQIARVLNHVYHDHDTDVLAMEQAHIGNVIDSLSMSKLKNP